jgi:GeoRSP system PqqD family protein
VNLDGSKNTADLNDDIRLNDRLAKGDDSAWRTLEGRAVILSGHDGMLRMLEEIGTRLWELLDGDRTVEGIIEILLKEYDVEAEVLEKDVLEFLNDIKSRGMIKGIE